VNAVYQEVNLVPTLSVAENLFLGQQPRRWWGVDWRGMHRRAREVLATVGMSVDVARPVGSLPLAIQQMVAIARAVEMDARVLVLDEPTSSLDRRECDELFEIMRRLRAKGMGLGVHYALHRAGVPDQRPNHGAEGRKTGGYS
jgi:simple sugar transport system ATP-binding protein